MTIDEEPNPDLTTHHNLLDWIEDSISFLPCLLNEPYCAPNYIDGCQWWDDDPIQDHHQARPFDAAAVTTTPLSSPASIGTPFAVEPQLSKKRKQLGGNTAKQAKRRKTSTECEEGGGDNEEEAEVQRKHPAAATAGKAKKAPSRSSGSSSGKVGSKEVRWAEQLLNSCAMAIAAANLSRAQHLLYVLYELASPSEDANHRLVAHGLRALIHHLSASGMKGIPCGFGRSISAMTKRCGLSHKFVSTEPRLFRSTLIKFQEVSPWFAFPNSLANASILHELTPKPSQPSDQLPRKLHIVDVGVSHGIQWPTLLEALTRRPGGPPALVRLTTIGPEDGSAAAPFAAAPPEYDPSAHLLRYAKSINLNLQIDHAQALDSGKLTASGDGADREETLVVCAQFRLHQLRHDGADDEREAFLGTIRDMGPDLIVLSEVEGDCCCRRCCGDGGFAVGFGRRVEFLWQFLDSTSAAFKGRDCGERRVVEGEAARAVVEAAALAGGGREQWRERLVGMGFQGERFCEDALDGGRALLRKYDGNWEMRVVWEKAEHPPTSPAGAISSVCLCWKGKPVSFCSLWKPPSPF